MRKYSLPEIDQMRVAVRRMILAERLEAHSNPKSQDRYLRRVFAVAEDQLRTYMGNGTDPQELIEAANEAQAAWGK